MVTERAHGNYIGSKTEKKAIRLPVVLAGGSLEPSGNGNGPCKPHPKQVQEKAIRLPVVLLGRTLECIGDDATR